MTKKEFAKSSSPRAKFFHGLMYLKNIGSLPPGENDGQVGWEHINAAIQMIGNLNDLRTAIGLLNKRFNI